MLRYCMVTDTFWHLCLMKMQPEFSDWIWKIIHILNEQKIIELQKKNKQNKMKVNDIYGQKLELIKVLKVLNDILVENELYKVNVVYSIFQSYTCIRMWLHMILKMFQKVVHAWHWRNGQIIWVLVAILGLKIYYISFWRNHCINHCSFLVSIMTWLILGGNNFNNPTRWLYVIAMEMSWIFIKLIVNHLRGKSMCTCVRYLL